MKKKLMAWMIVVTLLLGTISAVGAGVALAGGGYKTKHAAAARMAQLALWVAAINQGRWRLDGFVIQGPYGPAKGDPEWKGTVVLMRHINDSPSVQTCHIEVSINHDGETSHLSIHCEYALDF